MDHRLPTLSLSRQTAVFAKVCQIQPMIFESFALSKVMSNYKLEYGHRYGNKFSFFYKNQVLVENTL